MHYPIMIESQLAVRWNVSVKSLKRWRKNSIGPLWYILLNRHVRYLESDIVEFERKGAQKWLASLADQTSHKGITNQPQRFTKKVRNRMNPSPIFNM